MTTELAVREADIQDAPMTAIQLRAQVNLVQEVMKAVMRDGEHFGKIPGCGDKPTLLQPGAQKLIMTFRLVPDAIMTIIPMERGHREVRCKVHIYARGSHGEERGPLLGIGVGTCSTMEGKYRFRTGPVEFTDKPVPKQYWDLRSTDPSKAKAMLGEGMVPKKNDAGIWVCAQQGEKVEHDNPADYYNTVEKISFKRALVSATLNVTAASDIFTQDIEDMPEVFTPATSAPAAASPAHMPATQSGNVKAASVLSKMRNSAPDPPTTAAPTPSGGAAPAAVPRAHAESPATGVPPGAGPAGSGEYDAAWLSEVVDCEDYLRGSQTGNNALRAIRSGFKLKDDAYPVTKQKQQEYLAILRQSVQSALQRGDA